MINFSAPGDILLDRNVVTNSGQHGIAAQSYVVGVPSAAQNGNFLLRRNRTDHNGVDGIHIPDVASTTFIKNEASFNGNLGVEAAPGASGYGNKAKHNGNPAECTPVSLCKR